MPRESRVSYELPPQLSMPAEKQRRMDFSVAQGDITAQDVDAIVSVADTAISLGGGVAGAIREAAGGDIETEVDEKAPIELGGAAVTGGYELDAEYVVHAATMEPGGSATPTSIRDATGSALRAADDCGCRSVVLPALGCGVAGFEYDEGVPIIRDAVEAYEPDTLADVVLIAYGDEAYRTISDVVTRGSGQK